MGGGGGGGVEEAVAACDLPLPADFLAKVAGVLTLADDDTLLLFSLSRGREAPALLLLLLLLLWMLPSPLPAALSARIFAWAAPPAVALR